MSQSVTRRAILRSGVSAAILPVVAVPSAANYVSRTDGYDYEITRTEEEWREVLDENSFNILRLGHTEVPKSDPMWDKLTEGMYHCKGCDLLVYESRWKVIVDKGWLFYRHGVANALLMGVDWPEESGMLEEFKTLAGVETHCRRCGGHLGHIVVVKNKPLHCINGASLIFVAAT
jgi:peptide-methionine (R)-S-oxide reductase